MTDLSSRSGVPFLPPIVTSDNASKYTSNGYAYQYPPRNMPRQSQQHQHQHRHARSQAGPSQPTRPVHRPSEPNRDQVMLEERYQRYQQDLERHQQEQDYLRSQRAREQSLASRIAARVDIPLTEKRTGAPSSGFNFIPPPPPGLAPWIPPASSSSFNERVLGLPDEFDFDFMLRPEKAQQPRQLPTLILPGRPSFSTGPAGTSSRGLDPPRRPDIPASKPDRPGVSDGFHLAPALRPPPHPASDRPPAVIPARTQTQASIRPPTADKVAPTNQVPIKIPARPTAIDAIDALATVAATVQVVPVSNTAPVLPAQLSAAATTPGLATVSVSVSETAPAPVPLQTEISVSTPEPTSAPDPLVIKLFPTKGSLVEADNETERKEKDREGAGAQVVDLTEEVPEDTILVIRSPIKRSPTKPPSVISVPSAKPGKCPCNETCYRAYIRLRKIFVGNHTAIRSHKRKRPVSPDSDLGPRPKHITGPPISGPSSRSQRYERYQRRQFEIVAGKSRSVSYHSESEGGSEDPPPRRVRGKGSRTTGAQKKKKKRKPGNVIDVDLALDINQNRGGSAESSASSSWRVTPSPRLSPRAERIYKEKYFYVLSYEREDSGETKLVDLLGISEADERAWEEEMQD
jgi:hypothetical protein